MGDDFHTVGQQFCEHYYKTFNQSRQDLSGLYTSDSMLTYENESYKGVNDIMEKFGGMPKMEHKIDTFDA